MKPLDKSVVEDKHDASEPPRPALVPEEYLADVADILDFWMAEAEFPGEVISDCL